MTMYRMLIFPIFYVWLRKSIRNLYPKLFATITVPKEELVAADHRQGGKEAAKTFIDADQCIK